MIAAAPSVLDRARQRTVALTPGVILGGLFLLSVVVRMVLAIPHRSAGYFPDEWIYAGLSRSIAHGHLSIHGDTAHFPAILQPLLAAPLWRFLPVETAYRLVQVENAIAASTVVIPVYVLAKFVGLPRWQRYVSCVYALVIPALTWIPVAITDFVAYPLALGAVAAGVQAIDRPSPRRQFLFLALAVLATLARVQYFVVVPAYLVAALWMERRQAPRKHAVAFAAVAPVVLAVVVGVLSFYKFRTGSFSTATVTWIPLQAFLLAGITGGVIVPGAVAALVRPHERAHRAFAMMAAPFALALLAEASVYAGQQGRLKERYLFALLPLLAVSFFLYLKRGRPHRLLVLAVAAAMAGAAAYFPVTRFSTDAPLFDSQSLIAVHWLQYAATSTGAALIVTVGLTVGSALALLTGRRAVAVAAVPVAIALSVLISIPAIRLDTFLHDTPAAHYEWVADAVHGPVTLVATPASGSIPMMQLLYWNPSVDREVVLPPGEGSDPYAKTPLRISPSGKLVNVGKYFLFVKQGTQASFVGARRLRTVGDFVLYEQTSHAAFRNVVLAQLSTGYLSPYSVVEVWRVRPGSRVAFTLTRPRHVSEARILIGAQAFTLRPGTSAGFECTGRASQRQIVVRSADAFADSLGRPVTARLTKLRTLPPAPGGATDGCIRVGG